jgi:hypothetical protein
MIVSTRMIETIRSFETSVARRATGRHIPEDGIVSILSVIRDAEVNLHIAQLFITVYTAIH